MAFCPHCGKPADTGASFCTACGSALPASPGVSSVPSDAPSAPPTAPAGAVPAPYAAPPTTTAAQRPVGVTIIGIVSIVLGAFATIAAFAVLMFALFGASMMQAFGDEMWPFEVGGAFVAFIAFIALFFVLGFAALAFAAGWGSLQGKSWAWGLTIVVAALNGLSGVGELASQDVSGVLGIAVAALVIWYYFTPEVKAWFRRG